jgi:serine protease
MFCLRLFLALLLTLPAVAPTLAAPARATPAAVSLWSSRLVVSYPSAAPVSLPAGVRLVRTNGSQRIVDLGRAATPADLLRFPNARAVEPDLRVSVALAPSDPSYSAQWDMSDSAAVVDYSVHAPGAWARTTGAADLVVAVLDTGITAHAEFSGRTVAGYDMVSDLAVANDGDGRDANPADPGDWVTSIESATGTLAGCSVGNSSWHGTHVAGTIAASANNGIGIAGLNWTSKLQMVRVLGKCGGYLSDTADGITWASGGTVSGVPTNATPARVISLSLGGSSATCPSYLQSAVDGARSRGAVVVVAAGNSNASAAGFTPANCSGVITVAATGRSGKRAYYSNYGSIVDIAAPGGDAQVDTMILSTLNTGTQGPLADSYRAYQGTSMATPHVAAVLSLLFSLRPTLSESEALSLMTATATPFALDTKATPCSTAGTCGAGIINADALLAAAAGALTRTAQTISFATQPARVAGEAPYAPGASASSALPVTYTSSTPAVCTTDGSLVTPIAAGTCALTASQGGDTSYAAAESLSRSATIYASPTVVINSNALWTTTATVTLTTSYPSIAGLLEVSNDPTFATKTSYARNTTIGWALPLGDTATATVYLRVSGGTMVSPVVVSDRIGLDTTAPLLSAATASGKRATVVSYTILTSASDALSGLRSIAISLDAGKTTKATVAYAESIIYKTSSKTLYLRVQDRAGLWSAWRQVVITLW